MIAGFSLSMLLQNLFGFYALVIIIYVLMSWFPVSGVFVDVQMFLASVCEPYLGLFRRIVPVIGAGGTGIDISPIIAIFALQYIGMFIVRLLASAGL